jgi:peroxiredoxin
MRAILRLAAFPLLLTLGLPVAYAAVPHTAEEVRPLAEGSPAPAFVVRKPDGADWRFDPGGLRSPVMLIFYRGGWCPYCNAHLAALREAETELKQMGFEVLFLSADRPETLHASLKEPVPGYTLLSDSRMQAARAFGIAFRVDDATVRRYREHGIDLDAASGETHHELPVPAVFLVDQRGVIRFVHANPDYKVRISATELLVAARYFSH